MKCRFFYAVATMSGTMIGAGLFALPYVVVQSGFWIGLGYLVGLSLVSLILMFAYLEIVLSTKGLHHQLPEYASRYLGSNGKVIAAIAQIIGQYGALLVYIIAAGEILFLVFSGLLGGHESYYGIGFAVFCSIAVYIGVKALKKLELGLLFFVIAAVIFMFFYGLPHMNWENLNFANWENLMIPFGVVLFAFGGMSAVTIMDDILAGDKKKLKSAAFIGVMIPLVIYVVFAITAIGVSGLGVTEDAIIGLARDLGLPIMIIGSALLLLTLATSFFALGYSLQEVFQYDLRLGKILGWVFMISVPLALYIADIAGFTRVVGFTGAVLVGVQGIVVFLMYLRVKRKREKKPECSFRFPKPLVYFIIAVFIAGVITEIVRLII